MCEPQAPYVLCDVCGWSLTLETNAQIADWHRKPCPQCGGGEIVNDEEYIVTRMLLALMAAQDEIAPEAPRVTIPLHVAIGREKGEADE